MDFEPRLKKNKEKGLHVQELILICIVLVDIRVVGGRGAGRANNSYQDHTGIAKG